MAIFRVALIAGSRNGTSETSRKKLPLAHKRSARGGEDRDQRLYEAHRAVMKGYVAVPHELLANTSELARYLAKSYKYAKTLRPEATTRKPRGRSA